MFQDKKRRVLTWLDETKRLCHELRDTMNHRDYPPEETVRERIGTPVAESLVTLHAAVNAALLALAKVMVEDQMAVEMFADKLP